MQLGWCPGSGCPDWALAAPGDACALPPCIPCRPGILPCTPPGRFVAVEPLQLDGSGSIGRRAVVCARWTDEAYRARRCPPEEWQRRYGTHGVDTIWT